MRLELLVKGMNMMNNLNKGYPQWLDFLPLLALATVLVRLHMLTQALSIDLILKTHPWLVVFAISLSATMVMYHCLRFLSFSWNKIVILPEKLNETRKSPGV